MLYMSFINPYIFREYDVREMLSISEHIVKKLGKAFGTYVKRGGKENCN